MLIRYNDIKKIYIKKIFKTQNYIGLSNSLLIFLLQFNFSCYLTKFLLSSEKARANHTLICVP